PAIAMAVTTSGEATKECVLGLPSARFAKFLLKEVMIEFFSFFSAPCLAHCPIHGPQALARTTLPIFSNTFKKPYRSTVYLTCSEPWVMVYSDLATSFFSTACCAKDAALEISS